MTKGIPIFEILSPPKTICNWACVLYLSALSSFIIPLGNFIAPLVIWLLKKEDHSYLNTHGKEVLNFQLTMLFIALTLGMVLLTIAGFIIFFHVPLMLLSIWPMAALFAFIAASFGIINTIMMIVGAIKASKGSAFRLPFTYSFIK
jgi:uncharacterized Tic20 family protein